MSSVTYKCSNCGGPLEFKAESQNWKCEYCLSTFTKVEIENIEKNMKMDKAQAEQEAKDALLREKEAEKDNEFYKKAKTYICNSCGAEILTDETTAATFCYYCHNPAIIPGQLSGSYKPSKVIPFKIKKEAAREAFVKWCKGKPLLSRDFTSSSQLELLSGVYIPFWLYDCDVNGYMSADAKNIRTWRSGDKQYTETKHYNVSRAATASFSGIPADGSKKTSDTLMETLEPYDYSQLEDFSMSYLSGYFAEKYDVDKSGVYERVAKRITDYTNTLLRDTISGYNHVMVKNSNVDILNAKADYVLLPTWMFTYKYKDKIYVFAMNGQTGKIAGKLPISAKRAWAWFGAVAGGLFTILMLVGGVIL